MSKIKFDELCAKHAQSNASANAWLTTLVDGAFQLRQQVEEAVSAPESWVRPEDGQSFRHVEIAPPDPGLEVTVPAVKPSKNDLRAAVDDNGALQFHVCITLSHEVGSFPKTVYSLPMSCKAASGDLRYSVSLPDPVEGEREIHSDMTIEDAVDACISTLVKFLEVDPMDDVLMKRSIGFHATGF